ncbi:DUF3592 domain-containing protein [Serratia rubidaea]|uniref:DUF3592 domain-containing protein n=1 Tax=Serratia rubidaea TaxID=61652 RepID=UPI0022B8D971|nr:DUF3592 domain-containing protein [Serratia rubidaea]WBF45534.1 hypothetical protein OLD77_00280 [Serratia rubidaea]
MRVFSDVIVIAVVGIVIYALFSIFMKDIKNKKVKSEVQSDGVEVLGKIVNSYSRSGGNSGFINITVEFKYLIGDGSELYGKKDIVINTMDINKYQPGESISLRYSRKDSSKVVINKEHLAFNKGK